jgi:hypothetical protein
VLAGHDAAPQIDGRDAVEGFLRDLGRRRVAAGIADADVVVEDVDTSEHVERGFCRECGTPLFFRHDRNQHISMTIGSFDHPEKIPLAFQLGVEARLPQVDQLADIKHYGTTEEVDPEGAKEIKASNHQHPDYDTAVWPSVGRGA